MAEKITIENSYFTYIENQPYAYPGDNVNSLNIADTSGSSSSLLGFNTGWHILPTMLWKHFVTPKAWTEMTINYEAISVVGYEISLFNMVPLTAQLAIQGNNIFYAFNNTIYALGYQDKIYETNWYNWYGIDDSNPGFDFNLLYKEGQMYRTNTADKQRFVLPRFWFQPTATQTKELWTWNATFFRSGNTNLTGGPGDNQEWFVDGVYPGEGYKPSGLVWDPFNRPSELMELRPGKNAIKFSWSRHSCDADKWFNLDAIGAWFPYTASGPYNIRHQRPYEYKLSGMMDPTMQSMKYQYKPGTVNAGTFGDVNDYSIMNWADLPVVPVHWWWKEMQNSILPIQEVDGNPTAPNAAQSFFLRHLNLFFNGVEKEIYHYGPTQCFVKLIPFFNSANTLIECSAQVAVKTKLFLEVKKRRSALYCPSWGPIPWRSVYSARSKDRNFFPSFVRYRTGGMRRGWQNLGDSSDTKAHPRKTPYQRAPVAPGTGQGSTYATHTTTTIKQTRPRILTEVTPSAPPMDIDPAQIYPPSDATKL